jgi:N-acyl-L-homoserine lactone synthetase
MIYFVHQDNRDLFGPELDAMFKHRKAMFIDRLGWAALKSQGDWEVDAYDVEQTMYLICADDSGAVLGSMRLIPTQGRHMMTEVFADLCEIPPPVGPTVWEASRAGPDLIDTPLGHAVSAEIFVSVVDVLVANNIHTCVGVSEESIYRHLMHRSRNFKPLGGMRPDGDTRIGAFYVEFDETDRSYVREQFRVDDVDILAWPRRNQTPTQRLVAPAPYRRAA